MLSLAEGKYIKAIFKIAGNGSDSASTGAIATEIGTSPASVTDMLRKLANKGLIAHEKYYGARLTPSGLDMATGLLRRHRLWETFLYDKLGLPWDRLHALAEQFEHVGNDDLVEKLDAFLGRPKFDPHGDPIPKADGRWTLRQQIRLSDLEQGRSATVVGVLDQSAAFLRHLTRAGISMHKTVVVDKRSDYDRSILISADHHRCTLSEEAAMNIFVKPVSQKV